MRPSRLIGPALVVLALAGALAFIGSRPAAGGSGSPSRRAGAHPARAPEGESARAVPAPPAPGVTLPVPPSRQARLSVRVEGEGAPLAGATVTLFPGNDQRETGADGRADFDDLPGGSLEIDVTAPGRVPASVERLLPEGGALEVTIPLFAAALVQGKVLRPDGTPAAGAQVEALADRSLRIPDDSASAADDGTFTLRELVPATYTLMARAEGLAPALLDVTAPAGPVVLQLRAGASVKARLFLEHGGVATGVRVDGKVQPDGRMQVEGLAPGHTTLTLEGPGFAPRTIEVELSDGEQRDLGTLTLAEGGRIEGTLEGPQGAVSGSIRLLAVERSGSPEAQTSAHEGRFAFDDRAPGTYRLEAVAPGLAQGGADVQVQSGRTAVVPIRLGGGASISGSILAAPDVPGADARVTFTDAASGDALLHTSARPDGRFSSGPMPPGNYVVVVEVGERAETRRVELASSDVNLTIGPPVDAGSVEGVLRLESGPPLRHAALVLADGPVLAPTDAASLLQLLASPGALLTEPRIPDGRFTFDHVPPGARTLVVLLDGPGENQARALAVPLQVASSAVERTVVVPRDLPPFELIR